MDLESAHNYSPIRHFSPVGSWASIQLVQAQFLICKSGMILGILYNACMSIKLCDSRNP